MLLLRISIESCKESVQPNNSAVLGEINASIAKPYLLKNHVRISTAPWSAGLYNIP